MAWARKYDNPRKAKAAAGYCWTCTRRAYRYKACPYHLVFRALQAPLQRAGMDDGEARIAREIFAKWFLKEMVRADPERWDEDRWDG